MTAVLQLLVFVAAALGFAVYVLWKDKRENPPQVKAEDAQRSIYFPDQPEDEREHRGAAMSRP